METSAILETPEEVGNRLVTQDFNAAQHRVCFRMVAPYGNVSSHRSPGRVRFPLRANTGGCKAARSGNLSCLAEVVFDKYA